MIKIRNYCLLPILALPLTAGAQTGAENDGVVVLEPMMVTAATRTEKLASTLPQTITVVPSAVWEDQMAMTGDPIHALSYLVPSYSPSRQKMTGFGETFRGRNPLFLVDGVPQSNPLRDGSREGYTIDPIVIDQIEVVHGASAAQGMGATGGIINYVTRDAPANDGAEHVAEISFSGSDGFEDDSFGYRAAGLSAYRTGRVGVVASAAYQWRGMAYDADGQRIGVDNAQGDTSYSAATNFYGKFSYDITESQRVELFVNKFDLEQDLEYVSVGGDRANGVPVTSERGATEGEPAHNDVLTAGLTYSHEALFDGVLTADIFYQDFAATYGGGRFDSFYHNGEATFDQSQNESEKRGLKLTFARDLTELVEGMGIITGIDYLEDSTKQILIQTNREWVPETTYSGWAPYLQLEQDVGIFSFTGGVRYEDAELEVADYYTLEANNAFVIDPNTGKEIEVDEEDREPIFVSGGKPGFDEFLFNIGGTAKVTDILTLYASWSEGFGMPDVGRVLRGESKQGQDVDTMFNLEPIVTDNYELGVRWHNGAWHGSAATFYSTAELGSRYVRVDDFLIVDRGKSATYGIELRNDFHLSPSTVIGGNFAIVEGKTDADKDGHLDERLGGVNIPAPKLTLHWTQTWNSRWSTRLQTQTLFDRHHNDDPAVDFNGYTLVDFLISYRLGAGQLSLGIENILDKQYITYYSQIEDREDNYFAGRGRTFTLRYRVEF